MSIAHQETDAAGLRLIIESDDNPMNPRREFDNLCRMVCRHRRYQLGDPHNWAAPADFRRAMRGVSHLELPLYLYDHSGLAISTTPFSCPWDSGEIGWIIVERQAVLTAFYKKGLTYALKEQALDLMRAEVGVYDQCLTGDIWSIRVQGPDDATLGSCGGLFGLDWAINEGRTMLTACVAEWHKMKAEDLAEALLDERPDLAPIGQ